MRLTYILLLFLFSWVSWNDAAGEQSPQLMHWYRCNTHTHTTLSGSDVNGTPEFVAEWYRSHGYQCLVITDHEHLTDVRGLNRKYEHDGNFLVLKGQEISQTVANSSQSGSALLAHVNGINIDKQIMPLGYPGTPREITLSQSYVRNAAAIRAAGGIVQINHPNVQWAITSGDLLNIDSPFLFEIWNAYRASNNLGGIDDTGHTGQSPEELWDDLLSHGKVVWGVASDDAHEYVRFDDRESPTPGKAWTVVQAASLTVPAITEAFLKGHFYASTGISLESYTVDSTGISIKINPVAGARYKTLFIGMSGQKLVEVPGIAPHYTFRRNDKYVRAFILDSNDHRAWTQPAFRDGRQEAAQ